jgi:hypothetical protein
MAHAAHCLGLMAHVVHCLGLMVHVAHCLGLTAYYEAYCFRSHGLEYRICCGSKVNNIILVYTRCNNETDCEFIKFYFKFQILFKVYFTLLS